MPEALNPQDPQTLNPQKPQDTPPLRPAPRSENSVRARSSLGKLWRKCGLKGLGVAGVGFMGLGLAEAWGLGVWGLRFTVSFWLGVQGPGGKCPS